MIRRVENDHKVVVGMSKVRYKVFIYVILTLSSSFIKVPQTNSFAVKKNNQSTQACDVLWPAVISISDAL